MGKNPRIMSPSLSSSTLSRSSPPLLLPMWLAEKEKPPPPPSISLSTSSIITSSSSSSTFSGEAGSASCQFLMAKVIAGVLATISFLAATFIVVVNSLPKPESKILCPLEFCEDETIMTLLACAVPPVLVFGFALNVALWWGVRLHKSSILTTWLVVYEVLFYIQLFFQMSNIVPLTDIVKNRDAMAFLKSWIIPLILLWLNNNANQVVFRCRAQIRDDALEEDREMRRAKKMKKHVRSYLFGNNGRRASYKNLRGSRGSLDKDRDIDHVMMLPRFNPDMFNQHFSASGRTTPASVVNKNGASCVYVH